MNEFFLLYCKWCKIPHSNLAFQTRLKTPVLPLKKFKICGSISRAWYYIVQLLTKIYHQYSKYSSKLFVIEHSYEKHPLVDSEGGASIRSLESFKFSFPFLNIELSISFVRFTSYYLISSTKGLRKSYCVRPNPRTLLSSDP